MGLLVMVGPSHPLQSTCSSALRMLGHRVECLEPSSVFEAMAWLSHRLPNALFRGMLSAVLREADCLSLELEPLSVFGLLRALRRVRPDAVVCPEHLPSFAVMSLLRALREDPELRGLPVLISADRPTEATKDLARFGNLECLPRPVPAEALREWVGRVQ